MTGDGSGMGTGSGSGPGALPDVQRWQIPVVQHAENASLLSHTEEQISDLRQQTYDQAFQQGLAEGNQRAEQQCQQQMQQMQTLMDAMAAPLLMIDADVHLVMAELISDIVTAVTLSELERKPEAIFLIVEQAIALLDESDQPLQLHVNAEDAALLKTYQHESSDSKNWKIHINAQMQRGDVHIQSGHQFIKESLLQRIKRINEHVLAAKDSTAESEESS